MKTRQKIDHSPKPVNPFPTTATFINYLIKKASYRKIVQKDSVERAFLHDKPRNFYVFRDGDVPGNQFRAGLSPAEW